MPLTLYPYQRFGVDWLREHPRSILADDMGLGKTIQIGAMLEDICAQRVLILCRSVLAYQWQQELREHFGRYLTVAVDDTRMTRDVLATSTPHSHYVVTNYAKLRTPRYRDAILSHRWDAVIIDEATNIAGRKAKQSQGLLSLSKSTPRIHFLSGTDMPNGSPAEIFWWLHCIDPKEFPYYWPFVKKWCVMEDTEWGMKIRGAKDPTALAKMLTNYRLRRVEADVQRERPPLQTTRVMHDLSPRQRALYSQMRKDFAFSSPATAMMDSEGVEAQNTAARFAALRQVCLSPKMFPILEETDLGDKIKAIDAIFDEAVASKRKVVIYTWHRRFAEIICEHLRERGHVGYLIYGGQDPFDQTSHMLDFRINSGVHYLVGTIASMAEGINLQCASVVIFAERSYVPAQNLQAIKRVHREGQTNAVNVYGLVARHTIEEWIVELTSEKMGQMGEMELARRALEMDAKRDES